MIQRLRPYWKQLTRAEQWIVWREHNRIRHTPCRSMPYNNGTTLFDILAEQGVYQAEAVAGLWINPEWRPIIAKTIGVAE